MMARRTWIGLVTGLVASSAALADVVNDYEGLAEDFYGPTMHLTGVTYRDTNNVNGFYPDGEPFDPNSIGEQLIIENAAFFYDTYPDYGSFRNVLTFGRAFVPGDNLSIGALASVWMDLDVPASEASLDIAFYENGPWGGIEYRLEAYSAGQLVATDSFVISDLGGRDRATWRSMHVAATSIDSLHLYAWLNGNYTAPRGMIDDLTLVPVSPPCVGDIDGDRQVNLTDLAMLLADFGSGPDGRFPGDLNRDGSVDLTDLAILLANFGVSC